MCSIDERGVSCKTLQKTASRGAGMAYHALMWVPGAEKSSIPKAHSVGALPGTKMGGWRRVHGCSLLPYRPSALSHWWTNCLEDG